MNSFKRKIVIASLDPAILYALGKLLKRKKFRVFVAISEQDLAEIVDKHNPISIILDSESVAINNIVHWKNLGANLYSLTNKNVVNKELKYLPKKDLTELKRRMLVSDLFN